MSAEAADPLIGQRLGGALINRLLAKGLLSDVYLGLIEASQTPVAVKVLSPKAMAQGMSTERFMREGRALAQLSHPNIVRIYNVGVEHNRYFIVMDFVQDGANLRTLAKQHTLKPFQSLVVVRRMAEALEYIHKTGFIHRDIKPANICLRSNGQPILMDFSLIKDEGSDTQLTAAGTIMGTVNFMPPEQAQPGGPFGAVTPASDVYSLGATFYWLLTGQAPFKGRTPMETIIKLIREPVVPPSQFNPSVPPEVDDLCLKALAKLQADRFQSAREFIVAIDNLVAQKRNEIQAAQAPDSATDDNEPARPAPAQKSPNGPTTAAWGSARGNLMAQAAVAPPTPMAAAAPPPPMAAAAPPPAPVMAPMAKDRDEDEEKPQAVAPPAAFASPPPGPRPTQNHQDLDAQGPDDQDPDDQDPDDQDPDDQDPDDQDPDDQGFEDQDAGHVAPTKATSKAALKGPNSSAGRRAATPAPPPVGVSTKTLILAIVGALVFGALVAGAAFIFLFNK